MPNEGFVIRQVGTDLYADKSGKMVPKEKAFVISDRSVAVGWIRRNVEEGRVLKVVPVMGIPNIYRTETDPETWSERKDSDTMAAAKKTTKAEAKTTVNPRRKEYKVGEKTKAGCTILRVIDNPKGEYGHTRQLEIKCLHSGKPFTINTQDAHQTKYHPDVRAEAKRLEKAAKNGKTPTAAKAKEPAKKTPAKSAKKK